LYLDGFFGIAACQFGNFSLRVFTEFFWLSHFCFHFRKKSCFSTVRYITRGAANHLRWDFYLEILKRHPSPKQSPFKIAVLGCVQNQAKLGFIFSKFILKFFFIEMWSFGNFSRNYFSKAKYFFKFYPKISTLIDTWSK